MQRQSTSLAGCSILVVEDEPLVGIAIVDAFTQAGARVVQVRSLKKALVAVEDPTISAAIIDHVLSDGDSTALCERLTERNILCLVHSGYPEVEPLVVMEGLHVPKPADPQLLVTMVSTLLEGRPTLH
jgi:DNA-binding response OmpR family regulator